MGRGPHWLLSDQEAQIYGAALANALRHLPVSVGQKYVDFGALAVAAITIDGARLRQDMLLRRRPPAPPRPPAESNPTPADSVTHLPMGPIRPDFDA